MDIDPGGRTSSRTQNDGSDLNGGTAKARAHPHQIAHAAARLAEGGCLVLNQVTLFLASNLLVKQFQYKLFPSILFAGLMASDD